MFARQPVVNLACSAVRALDRVAPVVGLAIRLYVANVFFKSALTKVQSWDATLALFEYEYAVPLLAPPVAAWLGTTVELFAPVFLALGLGGRLSALVLFAFNMVAVVSYPDISPAGVKDHMLWGWLLAVVFFYGPGKLSVDHFVVRRITQGSHAGRSPVSV
jgi:putative oxidoreductase